jgi:nucleoside-diphosphate-sugar epimerase
MEPFEVWGNPEITRDVIYSDDFGSAMVALLSARDRGFEIFNVGTGRRTRVSEVVDWALRYAGHTPREIRWRGDAPISTSFRALDCAKLARITGWRPAVAIEDGIARTTQWWQANRENWKR